MKSAGSHIIHRIAPTKVVMPSGSQFLAISCKLRGMPPYISKFPPAPGIFESMEPRG